MKFLKTFLILAFVSLCLTKKFIPSQNYLNSDRRGLEVAQLSHIVRTSPTITADHRYALPTYARPTRILKFSNNNDNNGVNLGGYGRTAIIANPSIYVHKIEDISVAHHVPAVVGYRDETDTISSVNKLNGHVEQHKLTRTIPIEGIIEKVHTLKQDTSRRLDLINNQFGPVKTTISEKN